RALARPPAARSTPLPYTTPFRSRSPDQRAPDGQHLLLAAGQYARLHVASLGKVRKAVVDGVDVAGHFPVRAQVDAHEQVFVHRQDRKSTRLNSSHVQISYAVFCL